MLPPTMLAVVNANKVHVKHTAVAAVDCVPKMEAMTISQSTLPIIFQFILAFSLEITPVF